MLVNDPDDHFGGALIIWAVIRDGSQRIGARTSARFFVEQILGLVEVTNEVLTERDASTVAHERANGLGFTRVAPTRVTVSQNYA